MSTIVYTILVNSFTGIYVGGTFFYIFKEKKIIKILIIIIIINNFYTDPYISAKIGFGKPRLF